MAHVMATSSKVRPLITKLHREENSLLEIAIDRDMLKSIIGIKAG